ncbi:hypothetical protein [Streptomyces chrestomyceticus]|uniref:hypothetical protein n=1 Tax=Streptomyces chrestomyceticus TaxID=68185 RepID=UPI0033C243AA
MVTTDSVRAGSRFISDEQAQSITDHWNPVYPAMRRTLETVIKAQQAVDPDRRTVDVARLKAVRRGLGQLDRGTYKGCTRSPGAFSVYGALRHVDEVLAVTLSGTPEKGAIYRLASALADADVAINAAADAFWQAQREEREVEIPAQAVARGRTDTADSKQRERGVTR